MIFLNALGLLGAVAAGVATWVVTHFLELAHLSLQDRFWFAAGSALFALFASIFALFTDRFRTATLTGSYGRVKTMFEVIGQPGYPVVRRAFFAVPLAYFPALTCALALFFWVGDALTPDPGFPHSYHGFLLSLQLGAAIAAALIAAATTRLRYQP